MSCFKLKTMEHNMKPTACKSSSRPELAIFLGGVSNKAIKDLLTYFNELPESQFPYRLKASGTKEELINYIRTKRDISQKILWKAIDANFEDLGDGKKGKSHIQKNIGYTKEEFDEIWKTQLNKRIKAVIMNYVEAHLTQGTDLKIMAEHFMNEKAVAKKMVKVCRAYIKYQQ